MTAMSYITTHTVNYKFCKMASDSNIHTDELKSLIEAIQMENTNLFLHLLDVLLQDSLLFLL